MALGSARTGGVPGARWQTSAARRRVLQRDGLRVQDFGLMVQDSWFNVKRVTGLEAYGAQGLGVWDQGSESQGLGVLGLGLRAKGFGGRVCLRV